MQFNALVTDMHPYVADDIFESIRETMAPFGPVERAPEGYDFGSSWKTYRRRGEPPP